MCGAAARVGGDVLPGVTVLFAFVGVAGFDTDAFDDTTFDGAVTGFGGAGAGTAAREGDVTDVRAAVTGAGLDAAVGGAASGLAGTGGIVAATGALAAVALAVGALVAATIAPGADAHRLEK